MLYFLFIALLVATTAWANIHTEITASQDFLILIYSSSLTENLAALIVPQSPDVQISNEISTSSASTLIPMPMPTLPHSSGNSHIDLRRRVGDTVHTENTVACCLVKARAAAPTPFVREAILAEDSDHVQIAMSLPSTLATVAR
ncbi:hypothetical protein FKW77_003402 [Venturia effusa]|uniref:Uncharacterized protein n=1 Tax=Venturia effusa TaxID=50376 RepID=A0A517LAQ9_9PEZI|nr:hypothetical protein FKW77_003402 [Venturia effusa]